MGIYLIMYIIILTYNNIHSKIYTHTTDIYKYKKKLCGLSPQANYTDRAAAAGRRG